MRTFRWMGKVFGPSTQGVFRSQPIVIRRSTEPVRVGWLALAILMAGFAIRSTAADTNTTEAFIEKEYQQLHKEFQTTTNSAEVAWRFGRACFDMSWGQKDSAVEAKYAEEGIAACHAALALYPSSAAAHYYLGMNIGQVADTKRNLSAFRMVKDMEREFNAAQVLDKKLDYAGPDRNLGLLYRDAPAIVSVGSRSKARQHLEATVQIAPDFPENQLNLIESYLKWDYKTEALRQYGELEKMWPQAEKNFTGIEWKSTWVDWDKRLDVIRRKIEKNPKTEAPHAQ